MIFIAFVFHLSTSKVNLCISDSNTILVKIPIKKDIPLFKNFCVSFQGLDNFLAMHAGIVYKCEMFQSLI